MLAILERFFQILIQFIKKNDKKLKFHLLSQGNLYFFRVIYNWRKIGITHSIKFWKVCIIVLKNHAGISLPS